MNAYGDNFLSTREVIFRDESYKIIGASMAVHNELGCGFLEAVYQEALEIEFKLQGIPYRREEKLQIYYKDEPLEKYYQADFVCYDKIIVELKALNDLDSLHEAQLINYLKAANMQLGLLINFGQGSLQRKRLVNKATIR